MKRPIAAFLAGFLTWIVVPTLLNFGLRWSIDGYAAAEPSMTFTVGMMWARLAVGAATSLCAGAAAGWIAPASRRTAWVLGLVILAFFIPNHVRLWQSFPLWYHLTFLGSIVPLIVIGSRLARDRSRRLLADRPVRQLAGDASADPL